jgi:hypothetical protein
VQAEGTTVIREGHGTGEGRGNSPGEVHDTALKAAETDATKRALATFGKPFGLALYRSGNAIAAPAMPKVQSPAVTPEQRFGFHPDDTTPIPRPSRFYGRRQHPPITQQLHQQSAPPIVPGEASSPNSGRIDKSQLLIAEPKRLRDKGAFEIRGNTTVCDLRAAAIRPASPALCSTTGYRPQSQRRIHSVALSRPSPRAA